MNEAVGLRSRELLGASPSAHARVAGLCGILMLASGSLARYAASRLVVPDDAAATARNLLASEALFRLGLLASLVMMLAFLFYGLLLYRLLKPAGATAALVMAGLVIASVPLYMLNQVHSFAALRLAAESSTVSVAVFLDLHRLGNLIGAIFFGLWLFPLGFLVLRSGFLPKLLGVLLLLGAPGYLVLFVQEFFLQKSEHGLWSNPFLLVTHLAELALLSWLLIRGVNAERWEQRARAAV